MRWSNLGRDAEGDLRDGLDGAWALCKAQGCVAEVSDRDTEDGAWASHKAQGCDGATSGRDAEGDLEMISRWKWSRNGQSAPNIVPVQ